MMEFVKALLGKPLPEARTLCKEKGYHTRITSQDGIAMGITHDFVVNRVNLDVVNGIVTSADIG